MGLMSSVRRRPALRWLPACVAVLWLGACPVAAASSKALRVQLRAALKQGRKATGAPAATATVMRCGKVLWSGATGVKKLASSRPATPETMFAIASSTKPMTAAIALKLVERGELSLNTKLARFYPRLPRAGDITVRMLLDHTGGLSEYFDDPQVNQTILSHPDHRWTRKEVLRGITKTLFDPGAKYSYSNSAYVVLGGIVEKVTGKSIEGAFRKWIARPLGLANSTFTYRPRRSYLFAHPYLRAVGGLHDEFAPGIGVPADYWGPVWTDGGIASTSPDLARFGDALFRGKILKPATVKKMTRANRFGSRLGIDQQDYAGRRWLGHNGRYGGYESELWYDKTRGLTVAVNTDLQISSLATWKAVVDAYGRSAPNDRPCGAS
jgi:D-alanyl-D-alanine carboxypeptidase